MKRVIILVFIFPVSRTGICQVQTPQVQGFQPVNISTPQQQYPQQKVYTDFNGNQYIDGSGQGGYMRLTKKNIMGHEEPLIKMPVFPQQQPTYQEYQSPVQLTDRATTAEDVMRQANRGNPYYGYGNDPEGIQRANQAWAAERMNNDPAYQQGKPNFVPKQIRQQKELAEIMQRSLMRGAMDADREIANEDYTSPAFAAKTKSYADALQSLKDMLSGKRKLSVAQAYFIMENAYGESYLTQSEFNAVIKETVAFTKTWMQQNGLDLNDNAAKHYAIQKVMSERTSVTVTKQTKDKGAVVEVITHDPFFYDYNDYTGEKDHRDFFLTKCLATGMGQCNSMPAVYASIAEGLGATSYIAHAPQHALVKYPDNNGKMRNYEPTSNWDISDQWYLDNMFISPEAQQSGIYLEPMDSKQIVADCALQLAFGYHRKFGAADGKFINECINTAKSYFPHNNNVALYFTYSNLYGYQLGRILRANKVRDLSEMDKIPEAANLYKKWVENENIIERLGYEDNPPGLYEEMMKYHEFRGKVQEGYKISGKEKRSLFTKTIKQ